MDVPDAANTGNQEVNNQQNVDTVVPDAQQEVQQQQGNQDVQQPQQQQQQQIDQTQQPQTDVNEDRQPANEETITLEMPEQLDTKTENVQRTVSSPAITIPNSTNTPMSPSSNATPATPTKSTDDVAVVNQEVIVLPKKKKILLKLSASSDSGADDLLAAERRQQKAQQANDSSSNNKKDISTQKESLNIREQVEKLFVNSKGFIDSIVRETEKHYPYRSNYENYVRVKLNKDAFPENAHILRAYNDIHTVDHSSRIQLFKMLHPPTKMNSRQKVIAEKETVIKTLENLKITNKYNFNMFDSVQFSHVKGKQIVILTDKHLIVTDGSPVNTIKLKKILVVDRKPSDKNSMKWKIIHLKKGSAKPAKLRFSMPIEDDYELLMQFKDTYRAHISSKIPVIFRPDFERFKSQEREVKNIFFNVLKVLFGAQKILFAKEISAPFKSILVVTESFVALLDRVENTKKAQLQNKLTMKRQSARSKMRYPRIYPVHKIQEIILDKGSFILYPSYLGRLSMDDTTQFCYTMEKEFGIQSSQASIKDFPVQHMEQIGFEELKYIESQLKDIADSAPESSGDTILERLEHLFMHIPTKEPLIDRDVRLDIEKALIRLKMLKFGQECERIGEYDILYLKELLCDLQYIKILKEDKPVDDGKLKTYSHYFPVLKYKDKDKLRKEFHHILEYSYNMIRFRYTILYQFHKQLGRESTVDFRINSESSKDPFVKILRDMIQSRSMLSVIERNQRYFAKILYYHIDVLDPKQNDGDISLKDVSAWNTQLENLLFIPEPVKPTEITTLDVSPSVIQSAARVSTRTRSSQRDRALGASRLVSTAVETVSDDATSDTKTELTTTETDLITEDVFLRFPAAFRYVEQGTVITVHDVELAVKQILEHFLYHFKKLAERNPMVKMTQLAVYGDEKEYKILRQIVRGDLCDVLRRFFEQYLLETKSWLWGWGKDPTQSLWKCIVELSNKKYFKSTADIKLGIAVSAIEAQCQNKVPSKNLDDLKFNAFVCYSLNRGELHQFISLLVSNRAIMERYFSCKTFTRDNISKLLITLEKLAKLPFCMDYTFALSS